MIVVRFRKQLAAGAAMLSLALAAVPAHAQWTVFDPSNFSQNVLTAARTLQQINNQITSLQNEAQGLINQARMFDVWQDADVAAQFVQSFFDDLAWRVTPTTMRKSRIVRSLVEGLSDDADWQTAEDLQTAFADRLETEPWDDDEWQ